MRLVEFQGILTMAAVSATIACQSAQRPVALLPGQQATAPVLAAAAPPPAAPAQKPPVASPSQAPVQAPEPNAAAQQALSVDPVADLIKKVETEYQAGQQNYQAGHLVDRKSVV